MSENWRTAREQLRTAFATGADRVAGRLRLRAEDIVLNATMLGSVGVGKTTLLASMYERFTHVVGSAIDLNIVPERETSRILSSYVTTLKELPTNLVVSKALDGTAKVRHYAFEVGTTGRAPAFTLRFTDYPGRYLLPDRYEDQSRVEAALADSDVVLIAVDTPALMHDNGRFHEMINVPMVVTDEVKRLFGASPEPRLIVLTLLKSETYLGSPEAADRLIETVKERYRPLLDFLAAGEMRARAGCVVAAVQTIGSIRLFKVDTDDRGRPTFQFRSTQIGGTYAPLDTEQPLRYLLRFVINKYRTDGRPVLRGVWDHLSGAEARLISAVEEFARECKTSGGFAVVQDHALLHAPAADTPWRR